MKNLYRGSIIALVSSLLVVLGVPLSQATTFTSPSKVSPSQAFQSAKQSFDSWSKKNSILVQAQKVVATAKGVNKSKATQALKIATSNEKSYRATMIASLKVALKLNPAVNTSFNNYIKVKNSSIASHKILENARRNFLQVSNELARVIGLGATMTPTAVTKDMLDAAQVKINDAQASLDSAQLALKADPTNANLSKAVTVAQASLVKAKADLKDLSTIGSTSNNAIDVAKANTDKAQSNMETAQANFDAIGIILKTATSQVSTTPLGVLALTESQFASF